MRARSRCSARTCRFVVTERIPVALACSAVAVQIAYPLTSGSARDALTVTVVGLLALTALSHTAVTRGPAVAAVVLAVTALPAYAAEVVGVRTGIPFGSYAYSGELGPRALDVPLIVPLAWTMLAWPAALAARAIVRRRAARVLVGAWALTAADLFLDPQLVADGGWRWAHPDPHLPGVPDVPLTNVAGWLLVSLVLSAMLQAVLDRSRGGDDRLPLVLYVWLWIGYTVALGVFLDLRAAAAWGAVGMGTVALPVARVLAPARAGARAHR